MTKTKKTLGEMFEDVELATQTALQIAFDGCHKIYLSMDKEEADSINELGCYEVFKGTPEEMYERLVEWYEMSCDLKFISAVRTNLEDPNAGFETLVPQFGWDLEGLDTD